MKVKFVEYEQGQPNNCLPCCFWKMGCKHKLYPNSPCCSRSRADKKTGYFIRIKLSRKRQSKHERLLKALLDNATTIDKKGCFTVLSYSINDKQIAELIAIKEAIEKKGTNE